MAETNFNITGDELRKEKSNLNFSHLHIFDVLETPYTQNSALLSAIHQEKDTFVADNQNSFLIIDEDYKKPIITEKILEEEMVFIFEEEIVLQEIKPIVELEMQFVPEKIFIFEAEIEVIKPIIKLETEIVEEKIFIFEEKKELQEIESIFDLAAESTNFEPEILDIDTIINLNEVSTEIKIEPFLVEKKENIGNKIETEIDLLKNEEVSFSENISKNSEINKNNSKKEIILHKKPNFLVKIIVNEAELIQYFESNHDISFLKTDNMQPETISIIDTFLQKEPKLLRSRINISQKDTPIQNLIQDEEEEIVTETMAYLYATQGNKTEALRIYEKLILQFPEKSAYFAAKINTVNSEQ